MFYQFTLWLGLANKDYFHVHYVVKKIETKLDRVPSRVVYNTIPPALVYAMMIVVSVVSVVVVVSV